MLNSALRAQRANINLLSVYQTVESLPRFKPRGLRLNSSASVNRLNRAWTAI